MNQKQIEVTQEFANERLDKFLLSVMEGKSRSSLQKAIKGEEVLVNGVPRKANYKLHLGELVKISLREEPVEVAIVPEDIPLDILYEDGDVLVVNKPKGMVVHPAPGHYTGTLVNAIMYHCKDSLSGINGEIRPGIVHRIDMDTTGALIVCKNDMAHVAIAQQIKEHSVTRKYRGIVLGRVKEEEGTIEGSIGRHPTDRKKMAMHVKNGRDAITHYRVIQRFKNYTYCEFQLETGRTHQIRVHMASIGHPLLGDLVYGREAKYKNLQGQTLHAQVIGFIHPGTGKYVEVEAPLPQYFVNLLKNMEKDL